MATLEEFRALRAQVPMDTQKELFILLTGDPQASFQRMVEIAAEQGMTITVDEVKGFLSAMDEEDEFDDIELDPIALTAIAGGHGGGEACARCQEEAHDEPWGRCPGMRPMRKWLFGANPVPSNR